jgi:dTDP-glucose pyrophosphorylase
MIKVRGKPILLHIVEGLQTAGIKNFLIIVGYHAEAVRNYFGDGTCFGLRINYATQIVQDGTGRVVELAKEFVSDEPFLLHYGDILIDHQNYPHLVSLSDGVEAIVTVKANEDCSKGGAVFVNERMELVDLREKMSGATFQVATQQKWQVENLPHNEATSPWYNAGIYTFRPSIFEYTAKLEPSPRGEYELTDAIRELAQSGKKVQALELTGAWADVRDPEILAQLNRT